MNNLKEGDYLKLIYTQNNDYVIMTFTSFRQAKNSRKIELYGKILYTTWGVHLINPHYSRLSGYTTYKKIKREEVMLEIL